MMLHHVPQPPGGTLSAPHIEAPARPFTIAYFASAYLNVLWFEAGWRRVRVLAETPAGAVRIARYHHFRGRDHRIVSPVVEPRALTAALA